MARMNTRVMPCSKGSRPRLCFTRRHSHHRLKSWSRRESRSRNLARRELNPARPIQAYESWKNEMDFDCQRAGLASAADRSGTGFSSETRHSWLPGGNSPAKGKADRVAEAPGGNPGRAKTCEMRCQSRKAGLRQDTCCSATRSRRDESRSSVIVVGVRAVVPHGRADQHLRWFDRFGMVCRVRFVEQCGMRATCRIKFAGSGIRCCAAQHGVRKTDSFTD